jgi:predicted nucleotidyltransferase
MKNKVQKIINILNAALKENLIDFKGAYLYGSHAKNTSHKYSDIDIVILLETTPNREKLGLIWRIAGRIEAEYDVFLDLHPMTKEELSLNPFYYDEVVNKGVFYNAA